MTLIVYASLCRLHFSLLRPLPDAYSTWTTPVKAQHLAHIIGTRPEKQDSRVMRYQNGRRSRLINDSQRPAHGFKAPGSCRGTLHKVPAAIKTPRAVPIAQAATKITTSATPVSVGYSEFETIVGQFSSFPDYNPGYCERRSQGRSQVFFVAIQEINFRPVYVG